MVASVYIDTSAVIPTLVAEATSAAIEALLRQGNSAVVSQFTAGEVASTLSRLVRTGAMTTDTARLALDQFDDWCTGAARMVDVEPRDVRLAAMFVRRFELKLRMPDALQLAICRRLTLPLLTLDQPLAAAARALGQPLIPV